MKNIKKPMAKLAATAALSSVLALSLSACSQQTDPNVECYGVSKYGKDVSVVMPKGVCSKLAGSKAVPIDANDYVECYGVAAAGKNDCATNSSACGGTAGTDKLATAWVAIPKGICEQLAGAKVGAITSAPGSNTKPASTTAPAASTTTKTAKKAS